MNVTIKRSSRVILLTCCLMVWLLLAACTGLPLLSPPGNEEVRVPLAPLIMPTTAQLEIAVLATAIDLPFTPQPTMEATPEPAPETNLAPTPDTVLSIPLLPTPEANATVEIDAEAGAETFSEPDIVNPVREAETGIALEIVPARYHTVIAGDTLYELAIQYGTTVPQLQAANQLPGDLIHVGDRLLIPSVDFQPAEIARGEIQPEVAQPAATPAPDGTLWRPSLLVGNLAAAYPISMSADRFTLHHSSTTPPAENPAQVVEQMAESLAYLEEILAVRLEGRFDLYVAGSLFAAPDQLLRGRSFSSQWRLFVLSDGSGDDTDWRYITTHELTHLVTWNTFGPPSSALLSEGIAVYTGMQLVKGQGFLPLKDFCLAYAVAGQLPNLLQSSFLGHIRNLPTYYAAGCFVEYLIDKYGVGHFAQVYSSGDYNRVYQKSLSTLLVEWQSSLNELDGSHLTFSPSQLVKVVLALSTAYQQLFSNFSGTPDQLRRYPELDSIRLLLLAGQVEQAGIALASYQSR